MSFDGTWAKIGFTSLIGVFFAISVDTGEVLDYTVLSKACQKCSIRKSQFEGDADSFLDGDINFDRSSLWRQKELPSYGEDLLTCIICVTNGWYLMEIAKLSPLLKMCIWT